MKTQILNQLDAFHYFNIRGRYPMIAARFFVFSKMDSRHVEVVITSDCLLNLKTKIRVFIQRMQPHLLVIGNSNDKLGVLVCLKKMFSNNFFHIYTTGRNLYEVGQKFSYLEK